MTSWTSDPIRGWETGNQDKIERDKVFRYVYWLMKDFGKWADASICVMIRWWPWHRRCHEIGPITDQACDVLTNEGAERECHDMTHTRRSDQQPPGWKLKRPWLTREREPAVIACSTFITLCSIHAAVTQGDKSRESQRHAATLLTQLVWKINNDSLRMNAVVMRNKQHWPWWRYFVCIEKRMTVARVFGSGSKF